MLKAINIQNTILSTFLLLSLTACGSNNEDKQSQKKDGQNNSSSSVKVAPVVKTIQTVNKTTVDDSVEEIGWAKLIPPGYNPDSIIDKYIKQLEGLEDEDKEAMEIYGKIQAELDNAPVNKSLDGKKIKMPGFIAPLENENGLISEFLLVPYFGACIHSPPPPMNQTVMIKAGKGQGVKSEESASPVWITGELRAIEERTDIGAAGYRIDKAIVEPYYDDDEQDY